MALYLVTGGAGFIGSHIAETLVNRGERVRVVDNFATGSRANMASFIDKVEFCEVDITNLKALAPTFEGVDYVLHEAAIPSVPRSVDDPVLTHEGCVTGTLNVLIAARDAKVKRVVYAASSSAYGDIQDEYKVETLAPRPLSPYAAAKLAGEHYCQVFAHVFGLDTVCLRYFNVFGPRQDPSSPYSAVIPLFMKAMLEGRKPTIYGDGTQSRDFTYIDNVVHGNLLACKATTQVAGEVINMACGDNISLLQLVKSLNQIMAMSVEPIFEAARPGDVKHSRANIGKARRLLDFAPIVGFEEGLIKTLEWFQPVSTTAAPATPNPSATTVTPTAPAKQVVSPAIPATPAASAAPAPVVTPIPSAAPEASPTTPSISTATPTASTSATTLTDKGV